MNGMKEEYGLTGLIEEISRKIGGDIRDNVAEVRTLLDDAGLHSYLFLVNAFISFDPSVSRRLLLSGHALLSSVAGRAARGEIVSLLASMARVQWSAAVAALKNLPRVNGMPARHLVQWVRRGAGLAEIDQDVAIQYFSSSIEVLETLGAEKLDRWASFGQEIAARSWKAGKEYFRTSPDVVKKIDSADIERWARLGIYLLDNSPTVKPGYTAHSMLAVGASAGKARTIDLALHYFKSAPQILARLSLQDLEEWVGQGLEAVNSGNGKAVAFFALQTGESRRSMECLVKGLELKNIHAILASYTAALFGRNYPLRSSAAFYKNLPGLSRFFSVSDGTRIFLPSRISLFEQDELNIKAYKWLLAHELAHLSHGTFSISSEALSALPELEIPNLSFRIFELLEDERVDALMGAEFPGLEKDRLMLVKQYCKRSKPSLFECYSFSSSPSFSPLPPLKDAIAQVRTGGMSVRDVLDMTVQVCAALDKDTVERHFSGHDELHRVFYRGILDFRLVEESGKGMKRVVRSMADRLRDDEEVAATPEKIEQALLRIEEAGGHENDELVWQISDDERLDQLFEELRTMLLEMEEEGRFRRYVHYDEWDFRIDDYKKDWCRVREMDMPESSARTYNETVREYYGLVSILKRHFGMLRPDRFKRHFREERGDDLDFDALIETMVERHAGIAPSDKVFIRRDKKLRDVSVAFLADMSFSTSDVLPSGKRIIDVERDGLVLMAEALESIGDRWAVYGFSTNYREKVDFFVVKDFREAFGDTVKMRFEGIKPIYLTRLGAAIRHANSLLQRQDSLIRLLILLSDGRPYDVDYGDMDYSIEDTRMALWEGRRKGISSFCITVDKKSREYLPRMYGEANYTVIGNIDALPVTLPLIYKKLTT